MKHAFFVAALFCFLLSCKAEDSENFQNLWFAADVYRIDDYPSRTKQNGQPFKIIQFADTQLEDDAAKIAVVFDIISQAINDSQPDMLVLTGDNVSGENNDTLGHRLISFLDTFNVPYALVMGNHDGEGRFDNAQMGMIFGSGKHSLFQMGPDNIHGTGNYAVNIKTQNNDVFYTLIMLDSNRYRTYADRNGYDYIYPDQIDWYAWMIQGVSAAANTVNGGGGNIPKYNFFSYPTS